ncbi:MAG: hypothetical protein RSD91_07300 [Clostridiales bacterium]
MIATKTIKKAVYDLLKRKFALPVYFDEVIESISKPCFFVALEQEYSVESVETMFRQLTITITYYQEEASEADKIQKQTDLAALFMPIFAVDDRQLTVESITGSIYGSLIDVMDFDVMINFYDTLQTVATHDLMQNIKIKTQKGGD